MSRRHVLKTKAAIVAREGLPRLSVFSTEQHAHAGGGFAGTANDYRAGYREPVTRGGATAGRRADGGDWDSGLRRGFTVFRFNRTAFCAAGRAPPINGIAHGSAGAAPTPPKPAKRHHYHRGDGQRDFHQHPHRR